MSKCIRDSSRLTLEEAIKHARQVSTSNKNQCGDNHKQLAEWLEELKSLRELYKQLAKMLEEVLKKLEKY